MADEGLEFRSNAVNGLRGAPMGHSVFKLLRTARRGDLGNLAHQPRLAAPGKEALQFHDMKPNWGIPK